MKAELPTTYDNSMLTDFARCPFRFYLLYVWNLMGEPHPAPLFGTAIHAGLATWYETGELDKAIKDYCQVWDEELGNLEVPSKFEKHNGIKILEEYAKFWETEPFDKVLIVEEGFQVPLLTLKDLKFYYIGRIDLVVEQKPYGKVIIDHKTTARIPHVAPLFNSQLMGYLWAMGLNAAQLNYISTSKIDFYRTPPEMFNSKVIEQWYLSTVAKVRQILDCWVNMFWPKNHNACYQFYRPCMFMPLCKLGAQAPDIPILEGYHERVWEPFKHARKVIKLEE